MPSTMEGVAPNDPAPVRIGPYRLEKTIGVGSFGKVKLATHELTGHRVAVKILSRRKIKTLDMDNKVQREISVLKLFRHPHIIKLYEVIDTPTDIFLIMEYVSGGELFDYIVSHGRLSEDDARRFFQQIMSGIEYCHRHMVVHRDLKPENLLLDKHLSVKIADFGLSNIMTDGNFLKTSCGSPNSSPEVISGKLYAGPEVDVWSCGVILFALVCGRLPFDDEYIPQLFKKIKRGIFTIPHSVSPKLQDLLQRMLEVDPLQRITVSEIRDHPWYRTNLADYLSQPYEEAHACIDNIDEDVLYDLCQRLSVDAETAMQELSSEALNPITVAYQLIADAHRQSIIGEASIPPSLLTSSPPPFSPRDLPILANMDIKSSKDPLKKSKTRRSRWQLGVRSKRTPEEIMSEVYKVLMEHHCQWKIMHPYHLRVIMPIPPGSTQGDRTCKLSVLVYKLDERRHLVDFKKIEGSPFSFFDCCIALVETMAL